MSSLFGRHYYSVRRWGRVILQQFSRKGSINKCQRTNHIGIRHQLCPKARNGVNGEDRHSHFVTKSHYLHQLRHIHYSLVLLKPVRNGDIEAQLAQLAEIVLLKKPFFPTKTGLWTVGWAALDILFKLGG